MHCAVHSNYLCSSFLTVAGTLAVKKLTESKFHERRRRALKRFDRALAKGNFDAAFSLVKQLQGKPGGLQGFGAAKQIPKRVSSLNELELEGIDLLFLQSLVDSVLDSVERCIQFAELDEASIRRLESLMPDDGNDSKYEDDHFMRLQHEAGHFLVGYLLGVLPIGYRVPTIEALRENNSTGGRVEFLGFDFLSEVPPAKILRQSIQNRELCDGANKGKISSKTLNKFSCAILGGLVAEHLVIGYAEGLHSDVDKLQRVLKWLGFTETESQNQVKWAALSTVLILHQHHEARSKLAEAMALGRSVGFCIDTIENSMFS